MKKLFLVRGISGSGCSTLAHRISDKVFINQRNAYDAMKEGFPLIVIDDCNLNPFLTIPYIKLAKRFDYKYSVIMPATEWARDVKECFKRTSKVLKLTEIAEQYKELVKFPIHVFNSILEMTVAFEPHECLQEAQLALEAKNPCHADELVIDYLEWREEGGFPPLGGDEAIANISEKLKDWRTCHWESVKW